MLNLIFTLDYEIHGNGDGSPDGLMVEPTARMLDLFEPYGAKLTIMADVAEILKFREYRAKFGRDDFHYEAIVAQLRDAIRRGHDVQLHLHCSYFNAEFRNGKWEQDWSEYNFAGLSESRLNNVLQTGKAFLEEQLEPVVPNYRCNVFRAANWAVSPSRNVVRALLNNDFEIDTSVFKYGRREGAVNFDYSNAPSELVPWRASQEDICRRDDNSGLLEVPIYCERRWIGGFVSINRLYRAYLSRRHRLNGQMNGDASYPAAKTTKSRSFLKTLFGKHPRKADFNQCSGRQLIDSLRQAEAKYGSGAETLPFVLIGHSKLFTRQNQNALSPLLKFVAGAPERFRFGTFRDCRLVARNFIGRTSAVTSAV